MNRRLAIWLPLMMALVMALGIQIGLLLKNSKQTALFSRSKLNTLEEVLDYVQAKYVDTVNVAQLQDGAINDILEHLDPHSTFIPARDLKSVNQELQGNFEGIGIEFFIVADTITVVNVISGGPAEQIGLQAGDKIIAINDTSFTGSDIEDLDVVNHLRGPKGTKVTVQVKRRGVTKPLSFTITRDKIPMYSVDAAYMINDLTGYIKINRFSETTYDEFIRSIQKLKQSGMKELIVDLRQNGGGLLSAATDITDEFLDQQKLMVYTKGRVYSRLDYKTRVLGDYEQGPLAILIDEGSASASEIVAGAMQDWDRAVIVGRRSFGKGLVQEQYGLSDGSALRLTVAKYYTPSGRCIQKPYDHNLGNYFSEVVNRYRDGEVLMADSIHVNDTMKYYTSKGRVVFGGGGIIPDVFVPLDTSNNGNPFLNALLNQGLIQQFSYSWYHDHQSALAGYSTVNQYRKEFRLPDDVFAAFLSYAAKSNVQGTAEEISDARDFIALRIKAFFAREKFTPDSYYPVINDEDPVVRAAIDAIKQDVTVFNNVPKNRIKK